ncbi:MAG: hypothetical protein QXK96_03460 [Candidatus Bathyarchaeia archaeon]
MPCWDSTTPYAGAALHYPKRGSRTSAAMSRDSLDDDSLLKTAKTIREHDLSLADAFSAAAAKTRD